MPARVGEAREVAEEPLGRGPVAVPEESLEPIDGEGGAPGLPQHVCEGAHAALHRAGQARVVLADEEPDVASVSGKQLVATDPGEGDLVGRADGLRQEPGGHGGFVGVGLVQGVRDRLEQVPDVGVNVHLRQCHAVCGGEPPGEIRFVCTCGAGAEVLRGERVGGGIARQRPAGDHGGGVEAAAQERRDRHVAHQVGPDGLVEPVHDLRFQLARSGGPLSREIPVLPGREAAGVIPLGRVARLELANCAERCRGRRDVPELEIRVERVPVELSMRQADNVECLQLRREPDSPGSGRDVERLDAEPVAGEEQRLLGRVPDGEREHAAQPLHALRPVLFVEMQDDLGVALSGEHVSLRDQPTPELAVVVDLAVEDDDLRVVFVEDRLSSARQIDDAEPSHPEADVAVHVGALVVRPPMTNRLAHPPNHGRRNGPGRV